MNREMFPRLLRQGLGGLPGPEIDEILADCGAYFDEARASGGREVDWSLGVGYRGQRLFIVPDLDLVVLVHAGVYRSPLHAFVPLGLFNRYALAASVAHPRPPPAQSS